MVLWDFVRPLNRLISYIIQLSQGYRILFPLHQHSTSILLRKLGACFVSAQVCPSLPPSLNLPLCSNDLSLEELFLTLLKKISTALLIHYQSVFSILQSSLVIFVLFIFSLPPLE